MEQEFYKGCLMRNSNIEAVMPNEEDGEINHNIIYAELCLGKVEEKSKITLLRIVETLSGKGAEAVILGCAEAELLIEQTDTQTALYDTTDIHASSAVECAM